MTYHNTNLILASDSYKSTHFKQLPPGTEYSYSYIESRGGMFPATLMFGLQMGLQNYLSKPITITDIDEAEDFFLAHNDVFNRVGWERIVNVHGGMLPLCIKAVEEGKLIPVHNALVTVQNTDPLLPWLTSYVETFLLRALWYPTTVATLGYFCKQAMLDALNKSSDNPQQHIAFMLNDFGCRGTSSGESAAIGGCAHLVNFEGTDNIEGVLAARRFYGEKMAGFSVPAAEHSTICAWGLEHEIDAYRNMLTQFAKPGSIVAVVSDSYDLFSAISKLWGTMLRQKVVDSGATIVIRPDSGDPLTVPIECIRLLSEKFGYTVNNKGFKVLNSAVRCIQGDGITVDSIPVILNNLMNASFSAENIVFGMGGGLLQQVNRDTQKFAMKSSCVRVNGVWRDVYKSPITDFGKKSKRGKFALVEENGSYQTVPLLTNESCDILRTVYENGQMVNETDFSTIRKMAAASLGL